MRGSVKADAAYLSLLYEAKLGKKLDIATPKTLNEKIQWLKLHDCNPLYTTLADKYAARAYIASKVGDEHLVPLLGVWSDFDEIDFDALPNRFVLKCTHDSGGVIICEDKAGFDRKAAKARFRKWLERNYYLNTREFAYRDIEPRIIAEQYLADESPGGLKDYKIFCFNGRADYVEVDFNRAVEHKLNPYDFDWNPLNFCDKSKNDYSVDIPRPERLDDMRMMAETLAEGIDLLRVDFYSFGQTVYVGELTLYPGSGFIAFDPEDRDLYYGNKLTLSGFRSS